MNRLLGRPVILPGPRLAAGVLVASLLLVFVLWPVLRVLWASLAGPAGLSLAGYREFFGSRRLLGILINSLVMAGLSTVLTVLLALILAYAMTRTTVPGKRLISLVAWWPLVSPPFLAALALILLFGRDGAAGRWLGHEWSIYGVHGIVIAQVFTFLPQAWMLLVRVLADIDPSLEEAAGNLAARPLDVLRRVTLALARPGLASAALIVFVLCLSDFANPFLVGGHFTVLATEIYARVIRASDLPGAATLSVILFLPCLLASVFNARWIGAWPGAFTGAAAPPTALRPTSPALHWPLAAVTGSVVLLTGVVYGLIVLASFVRLWGSDWSLGLAHYRSAATGPGAWAVWNSLELAILSGVVGTALALPTAYLLEWKRASLASGARVIEGLGLLAAALPGTVLGVGYLLAFDVPSLPAAGTMWMLVASVVFWTLPGAVGTGVAALRRLDPAIEEAAVSLGAGPARTVRRILAPLLTGTALSLFVYFFVNGMVTVSAVIILVSPHFSPASVAVLAHAANGLPGAACALATILVSIVAGAVVAARAFLGPDRPPS
jgi:iron(III) transport system permease protein